MASPGSQIAPRDEASGSLTTGAIAGIACGAGALFLGAAGLFVVYWRRQRRFDREDDSDGESFDERRPRVNMPPAVTYTMDYKMDDPQHHEGDHASSYTYSPEKSSYTFSPLSPPDVASAMPTHPAYIPRALVRGSATPSNRSTATTSPPPFPSPPFPSSLSNPKTQPDDTVIQAYLAAATAEPQDSNLPGESNSSSSGQTNQRLHQSPTQPPIPFMPPFTSMSPPPNSASSTDGTTITTTSSNNNQTQQGAGKRKRPYLPPPLNLLNNSAANAKPLSGKESTTISGPLAFPQHYHHQYLAATQGGTQGSGSGSKSRPKQPAWSRDDDLVNDDLFGERSDDNGTGTGTGAGGQSQGESSRRTFRSRVRTSWGNSGGGNSGNGGEGKDKGKKHARKRSDRNSGGGNRHYAEIEIGRGSDIW